MPLKKRKVNKRSKQILQHRKDIIVECPYEIMCNVLYQLNLETLCVCLKVSVAWQNRISSVPEIWRTLKDTPECFWRDRQASMVLPFVSEHVEEISFKGNTKETGFVIDATKTHKFLKLRSLKLITNDWRDTTCLSMRLYHTLTRFTNTLKELHLETNCHSPLSIDGILSRCRNLTTLKCRTMRMSSAGNELPTPHLSLTSLELLGPAFKTDRVRALILRSLPNLQYLMLEDTWRVASLLPDILQHCPRLSIFSSQPYAFQHARDAILQSLESDHENQGMQSISIEYLDAVEPFMSVLQKCSHTLKHIYMSASNNVLIEPGWQLLSSIEMPQLTELHIVDYSHSFTERITSVIRRLSNLRTVNLENPYSCRVKARTSQSNEDLYDVLLELKHLSSLSLTRFDVRGQVFIRLMENCAASNCLTLLSLVRCKNLDPAVLHIPASVRSLRVLNLSYSMISIKADDVDQFSRTIEKFPQLHHLRFTEGRVSDESAISILRSKSLSILYLEGVEMSPKARRKLKPMTEAETDIPQDSTWINYM
ncbi:hypothetical protein BJV82DRAFT_592412 [Fennellomyces sp. T-0311]|nr:hypothetical protein BJV82DRAFT_592412 [Fennellomyces sp. T-0311]